MHELEAMKDIPLIDILDPQLLWLPVILIGMSIALAFAWEWAERKMAKRKAAQSTPQH